MITKAAWQKKNIIDGVISGLIAGVVFGFMLIQMGVLKNIGILIGSSNHFVGFIFHLVIDGILGIIFAVLFFKKIKDQFYTAILWGLLFGLIWWFVGTLTLAPMVMGLPVTWSKAVMCNELPMLLGSLVFGFVLGLCYYWRKNRK